MKIKKAKKKFGKSSIDALGERYTEANSERIAQAKIEDGLKNEIKELAKSHGEEDDSGRIVCTGNQFVVGFSQPELTPVLDPDLAEQHFSPDVFKKCQKKVFDVNAATRLFASGQIDPKTFNKCLVKRTPQQKIYVKRKS